jgi:hypothetical protein
MDSKPHSAGSLKALVAVATAASILFTPLSASAAINAEKKIGQFGSPVEWRLECVKWASGKWPWGGGWKTCVGHKYEILQHEFFVTANGPDLDQAANQVVQEALGVAVSAAVGVGLLTPSPEPMARVAVAIGAAKTAFIGYLAARGLERIASQYDVHIVHRTHW